MRTAKYRVIIRHIFVLSLLIFPALSAPRCRQRTKAESATTAAGMPTLRGEAALTHLKERGLYTSLGEAVKAARHNAQPLPPDVESLLSQTSRLTAYLLTINCPRISIEPTALEFPNITFGVFFNQTFSATGGVGTYTYAVEAGSLPRGLTLDASTGVLSGTPSLRDTFNFIIRATDSNGCIGRRPFQVVVN
jgi:hypothetical protein